MSAPFKPLPYSVSQSGKGLRFVDGTVHQGEIIVPARLVTVGNKVCRVHHLSL